MKERVVMLLYLLMRDELPTGTVADLIKTVEGARMDGVDFVHVQFTNKHLESMAREYVERMLK